MDEFARFLSSALVLTAGCVETLPPLDEVTSLRVEVQSPADLGSVDNRLPAVDNQVTFTISAINAQGEIEREFDNEVAVHTHFLGSLTPNSGAPPSLVVPLSNGVSETQMLMLPKAFGPTFLWAEDKLDEDCLLYTSPSPRDATLSRMPSSA